jgi:RNA polymerase sigma-70 factor (ECF subfamily)
MTSAGLDVDRLYRDHGHVVLRRARRILDNESEAREVTQEVFMSLVENPRQFHGRSSVTTFLYAVTTNACLNRLRSTNRRAALVERHVVPAQRAEAQPVDAIHASELLARLPERLARVAVYYFVDEMTHDEIASLLGLSRRHVGNLVAEAIAHAREAVELSA